jgi:hypothetical protein
LLVAVSIFMIHARRESYAKTWRAIRGNQHDAG